MHSAYIVTGTLTDAQEVDAHSQAERDSWGGITVRLSLDAAPVIYTAEQVSLFAAAVDGWPSAAEVVQVVSDLRRMKCRVKPLRDGTSDLL